MFEIRARLHLGRALLDVDAARANEVLLAALEIVDETEARGYEPFIREELARAYNRRGDDDACARETTAARRLFDRNGAPTHFERVGSAPDLCHESGDTPTIH